MEVGAQHASGGVRGYRSAPRIGFLNGWVEGSHTLGGARFYGLCGGRGKQTAVALPRTTPPAPLGLGTSHTLVSYRARGYRWERFGMGGGSDAGRRKVEAGVDARGAQKAARRQVGTRGEPTFGEASFLIAALQISMALSCTSGCRVVLFTTALGSIPEALYSNSPSLYQRKIGCLAFRWVEGHAAW